MMRPLGILLILLTAGLLLSACITGRQGTYYHSIIDAKGADNLIPLSDGEKPEIIFSKNIKKDQARYEKMGFVAVGQSDFENREKYRAIKSTWDSHVRNAVGQAMKISATHVLYYREKTDEYSHTRYNKDDGGYDTEHYEVYQNSAVYLVRKKKG